MSKKQRFGAVFAIMVVAAMLRSGLAGNQPLWNDEVFSLAMVTGHSLEHPPAIANPALGDFVQPARPVTAEELCRYVNHDHPPASLWRVVRAVFLSDTSPPLYYFLLYGWTLAFGTSDAALRGFSIICSLACFPFLAGIARRVAGPKAVIPSCLLFCFAPLGICFSTEGRMYSLLWLCVVAVTWVSLLWSEQGTGMRLPLTWIAISAAGFLTHYFFVFPWTALVAFLVRWPEKLPRRWLVACVSLTAVVIFPWYMRVPESLHGWRIMKDWLKIEPPSFNRLEAAFQLVAQNFSGAGHHQSSNFVALVIFAVIGVVMASRLRLGMFGGRRALLWLSFAAACAGPPVFDFIMHTYTIAHDRYAIAALPMACLLAAAGLATMSSATRKLLLILVLVVWCPNLLIFEQTAKRQSGRHRAEVISAKETPTDLVLIDAIPSGLLSIVRYLKGPAPVATWLPSWVPQPATGGRPEWILEIAAGRTRILWLAGAGAPAVTPERDWLRANAVAFEETTFSSDFRPRNSVTF